MNNPTSDKTTAKVGLVGTMNFQIEKAIARLGEAPYPRLQKSLKQSWNAVMSHINSLQRRLEEAEKQIEAGHQISGSFFEALKPLNLKQIYVANPGLHVKEALAARDRQIEAMKEALQHLMDAQNGPPLHSERHIKFWNDAMEKSRKALALPATEAGEKYPKVWQCGSFEEVPEDQTRR